MPKRAKKKVIEEKKTEKKEFGEKSDKIEIEKVKKEDKRNILEDKYLGRSLAGKTILEVKKTVINGRDYLELKISDLTTQILNEKDLEEQIK